MFVWIVVFVVVIIAVFLILYLLALEPVIMEIFIVADAFLHEMRV